jgi:hypothetical protein
MSHRTYRENAVYAGIFLIIATAFLFIGEANYKPPLVAPDVLETAALSAARIRLGIMIEFSCVLAIPLVAIALYPVLRLVSPALAVGYVAFRLFEATIFAGMEIDKMVVVALSEAYLAAPGANAATLNVLIAALIGGEAFSGVSGAIYNLGFITGMLMLNWMLWTARLVPRWISVWGMISAVVLGTLSVAVLFVAVPGVVAVALIAPLAVQEMVLAVWWIAKGFDRAALARLA